MKTTQLGLYWILRPGLAASALLLATATGAPAAAEEVAVSQPWMRFITPNTPAAGYFTLTNNGEHQVVLTGADSPDCRQLMLHQSVVENHKAEMKMVTSVVVSPHGSVTFEPGGYHLMCMSPAAAAAPGHSVPVTLHFEDGRSLTAQFPVRGATGK